MPSAFGPMGFVSGESVLSASCRLVRACGRCFDDLGSSGLCCVADGALRDRAARFGGGDWTNCFGFGGSDGSVPRASCRFVSTCGLPVGLRWGDGWVTGGAGTSPLSRASCRLLSASSCALRRCSPSENVHASIAIERGLVAFSGRWRGFRSAGSEVKPAATALPLGQSMLPLPLAL